MIAGIADTHTVLWYLARDPRLSLTAERYIDRARLERNVIAVSTISVVEAVYLVEKHRISVPSYNDLVAALTHEAGLFQESPVTAGVAAAMRRIRREDVPDMPDRIVAATGVYLGVPILSRDGKIRAAGLQTIW